MNVAQVMNFGTHQNCDLFFRGNVKNGNGKRQFFLNCMLSRFSETHRTKRRGIGDAFNFCKHARVAGTASAL